MAVRTSSSADLTALLAAAVESAEDAYRAAIAAEIDGTQSRDHWLRVRTVMARAWIMGGLVGMEDFTSAARMNGAEFDEFDANDDRPVEKFAARSRLSVLVPDDGADGIVVGPFLEAVQAFDAKVPRLRSRVRALAEQAARLASDFISEEAGTIVDAIARRSPAVRAALNSSFWASDTNIGQTANLRNVLAEIIRSPSAEVPKGLPDFIDEASRIAPNLTDARLEVVMRNNLSDAFNEGQAAILRDDAVRVVIPLAEINEIKDTRTRDTHRTMDGYVNTIDEIDRQGVRPPCGHQCRGTLRPVPIGEAKRRGFITDDGQIDRDAIARYNGERQGLIDRGLYPDPGWLAA